MASWFQYAPVSKQAPKKMARMRCARRLRRRKSVRIALLGTRGIPASYGGFETFAEELSTRLVERGHQVTVYCREPHPEVLYPRRAPAISPHHPPQVFRHAGAHLRLHLSSACATVADVALYCNGANAIFTVWPRLFGHSRGAQRGWHRAQAQEVEPRWRNAWYLVSEWLATFCPTVVVTDALTIQEYYRRRYRKESSFIPYGAELGKEAGVEALAGLGLEAGPLLPLRQPPGAGESSARSAHSVRTGGHAAEAGADRRRALRARVHSPGARHQRPAHRDARRDLRRRAIANWARTASRTSMPLKWGALTRR